MSSKFTSDDNASFRNYHATLCVLGGSSAGTIELIEQLYQAQCRGELAAIQVNLWGRNDARVNAVRDYCDFRVKELSSTHTQTQDSSLIVSAGTDIAQALQGCDLILCQVRPGGMSGRSLDEQLPLPYDIPGDEGLGPSGLACYLRSRSVMSELIESCRTHAPQAALLMMTSPLGLLVELATDIFGERSYGVCELPTVTAQRVKTAVADQVPNIVDVQHLGLNHQAWLHKFTDVSGSDVTADVLQALPNEPLVDVEKDEIIRAAAVPLPYMRLYYHTQREVDKQRKQHQSRGDTLDEWNHSILTALGVNESRSATQQVNPDYAEVARLLAGRNMNWYEHGVVPVCAALLTDTPTTLSLNKRCAGLGSRRQAVSERPFRVSRQHVEPIQLDPLPNAAARFIAVLSDYEGAVMQLGDLQHDAITEKDLESVLMLHPLVTNQHTANKLALRVKQRISM